MKLTTKKICEAGIILAILVASQIFKGISVYITGPIVNACLVLATMLIGLKYGIILSVISPVTSFFITGTPVISACPIVLPLIMLGNVIMVFFIKLFYSNKKTKTNLMFGMAAGSVFKAAFMGSTIILAITNTIVEGHALYKALPVLKMTFSVTQLITAVCGCILAFFIYYPVKKYIDKEL